MPKEEKVEETQEETSEEKPEESPEKVPELTDEQVDEVAKKLVEEGVFKKEEIEEEPEEFEEPEEEPEEPTKEDYKRQLQEAKAKLRSFDASEAAKEALEKYPNADKEIIEDLAKKRRPKQEIFRIAKISQSSFERGSGGDSAVLEKARKIITEAWGKPDTGGETSPSTELTPEELRKMTSAQRKEAVASRKFKGRQIVEDFYEKK